MGVWIGLFVTITLALLGLIKKKSKYLLFLQWSWIWLIQGFYRGGMDYHMNEFIYNNGGNPVEWLTYGIIKLFRLMGLDYMWYRLVWMTIGVIILYMIVKSYSQYPCLVMFPYVFFMLAFVGALILSLVSSETKNCNYHNSYNCYRSTSVCICVFDIAFCI